MNYFELFGMPVQLKANVAELHSRYITLSRQYHPDYFVKDGHEKLNEMQEISATLNKAYTTFRDPDATIKYVLQVKGLLEEEEKYALPPDFLMEVMQINEELMGFDKWPVETQQSAVASIQTSVNNLQTEIYEPVKEIIEHYEEGVTTREALLQVKEYYYKKKYLDRIRRELAGKA